MKVEGVDGDGWVVVGRCLLYERECVRELPSLLNAQSIVPRSGAVTKAVKVGGW